VLREVTAVPASTVLNLRGRRRSVELALDSNPVLLRVVLVVSDVAVPATESAVRALDTDLVLDTAPKVPKVVRAVHLAGEELKVSV